MVRFFLDRHRMPGIIELNYAKRAPVSDWVGKDYSSALKGSSASQLRPEACAIK